MDRIVWTTMYGKPCTLGELENEHLYNILNGLSNMKFSTKPCGDNVECVEDMLIEARKRNIAPLNTLYEWRRMIFLGQMYPHDCRYMIKQGIKMLGYDFYANW